MKSSRDRKGSADLELRLPITRNRRPGAPPIPDREPNRAPRRPRPHRPAQQVSTCRLVDFSIFRCGVILALCFTTAASAGPTTAAIRETAEYVLEKFAKESGRETVESLSGKIAGLAARSGDDAVEAVRRIGPRAFRLAEEAGEHGTQAVKLMARLGDDAAWVVSRPRSLAAYARYGDDAADAMLKHKSIAEPLLEAYGSSAARALKAVDGQGGRRLHMMLKEGLLTRTGRADELLGIIERFGDRALAFIWRHKGVLAGGAALAAFISDPQPYFDGVVQLTGTVGSQVAEPLKAVSLEAARRINWTLIALVVILLVAMGVAVRSRHAQV